MKKWNQPNCVSESNAPPFDLQTAGARIVALIDAGSTDAAREQIEAVLVARPLDYFTYLMAATAYTRPGDETSAMAALGVAIALESFDSVAFRRVGMLLRRQGRTEAALRVLERGWERASGSVEPDERENRRIEWFQEPEPQ